MQRGLADRLTQNYRRRTQQAQTPKAERRSAVYSKQAPRKQFPPHLPHVTVAVGYQARKLLQIPRLQADGAVEKGKARWT